MTKSSQRAYTLVEIMVVVAIIAIFLSIVLPSYVKASRASAKNICINNLQKIDAAIDQWAFDNRVSAGTLPTKEHELEIYTYVKGGKPRCPSSGEYTIYKVNDRPQVKCSREDEGHKLPE